VSPHVLARISELPEPIFRNHLRVAKIRARCIVRRVVVSYPVFCAILAIFLGELAFRPQRVPIRERPSAETTATRYGAVLRDVSVSANGTRLQGWIAHPASANGDAVILLHGVGDNRQGMMGLAERFLSNGFAVLLPDSRAQGESGGDFPTYGLEESEDVHRWFDWLVFRVAIVLWEVPKAGHCGAANAAGQEFDTRVIAWFTSHNSGYATGPPP
jgi:hypothetical protein